MDIMWKLQSILAPSAGPVNRALPPVPRPATPSAGQSFRDVLRGASLEDPSIAPFGVVERLPKPVAGPGHGTGATGPTILPEIPEEPVIDLPVDSLPIEIHDTLESTIEFIRLPDAPGDPLPPPVSRERGTVVVETPPPTIPGLPPIGRLWSLASLVGSGASGPGIDGSGAGISDQLRVKVGYYLNPEAHGVELNTEGRLFRDAVAKGYVTGDAAGLASLLGQLNKGAVGPEARPAEVSVYFNQFFAAERAAGLA